MKIQTQLVMLTFSAAVWAQSPTPSERYKVIGWNDLGMHCVDGNDYSIFSILPPYNNVHAQLIDPKGKLVKAPNGITLTYQAVADPDGSINRTSINKTNFWQFVEPLFGVKPAPDMGLAGASDAGQRESRADDEVERDDVSFCRGGHTDYAVPGQRAEKLLPADAPHRALVRRHGAGGERRGAAGVGRNGLPRLSRDWSQ